MRFFICSVLAIIYTLSPVDASIFYAPDLVPFYGQTVGAIDDVLFDLLMAYIAFKRRRK